MTTVSGRWQPCSLNRPPLDPVRKMFGLTVEAVAVVIPVVAVAPRRAETPAAATGPKDNEAGRACDEGHGGLACRVEWKRLRRAGACGKRGEQADGA